LVVAVLVSCVVETIPPVEAGISSAAIRELTEAVFRRAGRRAGTAEVAGMAGKIESLVARHGDEAVSAIRRVGPEAVEIAARSGNHGKDVVKLMARHGDESIWIISHPDRFALFLRYGDDAAEAMVRHRHMASKLVREFGGAGAQAIKGLGSRNARRLSMMQQSGDLQRLGRTAEILKVIGRYGDKAAAFIWRNKGALAVAAVLAAFLKNPEVFINAGTDLAKGPIEEVADKTGDAAAAAAATINWTIVLLAVIFMALLYRFLRLRNADRRPWSLPLPPFWWLHRSASTTSTEQCDDESGRRPIRD
jgi:hypothetical protein